MVIYPDCHIDPGILMQAVINATMAEPITRCRLVKENNMLWWENNPDLDDHNLVIRVSSLNPEKYLHEALSRHIDPYHDPLIHAVLLESENTISGDILVLNVHHVAMDGRGLKDMARLIMSQYRGIQSGELEEITPTSLQTRNLPRISSLVSSLGLGVNAHESTISWSADFSVPVLSLDDERQSYSLLALNRERMKIIQRARKEWGVTFNDLMLAVIAQICADISGNKGNQVISLLNTIDLRRYLVENPARSVLNYSTAFEVKILVRNLSPLKDTVLWVAEVMNNIKAGSPGLGGAFEAERLYELGHDAASMEIQGRQRENKRSGKQIPLFTNIGIIPPDAMYPGIPVRNAYMLPTHSLSPTFFFSVSTYQDQVTISSTYYQPAFDAKFIEKIYCLIDKAIPGFSSYPGVYAII